MAKAYLSQLTMFSKKYAMKEIEDCINEAFDDKFWESVAEIDKNYPEFAKYNKEHCDIWFLYYKDHEDHKVNNKE